MRAVTQACAQMNLVISLHGSGLAFRQSPAAGAKVRAGEMQGGVSVSMICKTHKTCSLFIVHLSLPELRHSMTDDNEQMK